MESYQWKVNIGSDIGSVWAGNKPLPEPGACPGPKVTLEAVILLHLGNFQWAVQDRSMFHTFIPLSWEVPICAYYTPAQRSWRGVYWIHLVRPSVCRRHGFRSISQVCFGISISNFISMLMVVIGRSLLIFSDITFKMAAWRPYWIFGFPDSNFSLALNINFKLQWHNTYVYG